MKSEENIEDDDEVQNVINKPIASSKQIVS